MALLQDSFLVDTGNTAHQDSFLVDTDNTAPVPAFAFTGVTIKFNSFPKAESHSD